MEATLKENAVKSVIKSLGINNKQEAIFRLNTDNVVYGSAKVWLRKYSPVDRQYNVKIQSDWARASQIYYCVDFETASKLVTRHIDDDAVAPARQVTDNTQSNPL